MAASMWALSAGLAVVLLVGHLYECSATPTSISGNNCQVVQRNCWRPFNRFAGSNFTQVTELCHKFSTLTTCMGACRESMQRRLAMRFQVMTYLCDPSRREMMIEAASAECFNDTRTFGRPFGGGVNHCVDSNISMQVQLQLRGVLRNQVLVADSDELCSALETLASCMSENLASLCGSLVAQIGETAYRIATRSYAQEILPACFVDQPEGEVETIPGSRP